MQLNSASSEQKSHDLKGRICEESKKIWRIALPSVISRLSLFGTMVVSQSFIGHINSTDLAAYALVQTLTVRFVNGILIGMSSATETLCGQAFGAKQYHMMGIFLQRSWLINLVTLTILLPVFIFATPIFELLREGEAIANSAGSISLWFIPFIYSMIFSVTIHMYLQAQQKNAIIAWLSLVQFTIHMILAFCLCYEFRGPWSNGCTMHVLMAFGVWRIRVHLRSVRVANELGRGDAKVAKFSIKVLISTSTLIGLLFWVLCLVFGNKIGYLFTKDEEVPRSVSDLSILLAFSVLLNGIYPVLTGVAIGAGLQTKMAIINLICFYLIGLPIGAVLGYVTHLQVKGIWIEMISGVVAQTLALIFMTWRTNWDKEVCITSSRLNRWYLKSEEENNLETK
ncbi:hypothetical protein BUALT_Bualt16G0106400 [Buddleja alternifolia]|uniref:Multidrug and toxic compound extrusion protein n=1 Tax=Buddleja alternifolia TaxID=168488 RepID=A0AAV6WBA9_9LAMI|nr:hypothetical protein BUALT_Bualt16G0106400 [Buddleja alternifolia]